MLKTIWQDSMLGGKCDNIVFEFIDRNFKSMRFGGHTTVVTSVSKQSINGAFKLNDSRLLGKYEIKSTVMVSTESFQALEDHCNDSLVNFGGKNLKHA